MLKGNTGKLEPRTEVCLFVGYPKGTRGGLFYSPQDKKVFVSTNATFLENDYMENFKPRNRVVLEELQSDHIIPRPVTVTRNVTKRLQILYRMSLYLDVVGGFLNNQFATQRPVKQMLL